MFLQTQWAASQDFHRLEMRIRLDSGCFLSAHTTYLVRAPADPGPIGDKQILRALRQSLCQGERTRATTGVNVRRLIWFWRFFEFVVKGNLRGEWAEEQG